MSKMLPEHIKMFRSMYFGNYLGFSTLIKYTPLFVIYIGWQEAYLTQGDAI